MKNTRARRDKLRRRALGLERPRNLPLGKYETPPLFAKLAPTTSLGVVARSIGTTTGNLSRVFRGQRRPSLQAVAAIAANLGCSIDILVHELIAVLDTPEAKKWRKARGLR